jgi:hypothetical protein
MIELIVSQLIRQFHVLTPPLALINLPEHFLKSNEFYFLMGNKRIKPEGNLHLGSRVPVNPETTAIFDFLPIRLIPKVRNSPDFATMFVLDKWFHQSDYRQAVFVRDTSSRGIEYLAHFIDHGKCLDWESGDAPLHGLVFHKKLYSEIKMRDLTRTALSMVAEVSEQMLLATTGAIPSAWCAPGDHEYLETLLRKLRKRQTTLPLLIDRHLTHLGL